MARAAIKISADCVSPHLADVAAVDLEGTTAVTGATGARRACPLSPIVIEASSPGLAPSRATIATSVDQRDSVLSVASLPFNWTYTDGFEG